MTRKFRIMAVVIATLSLQFSYAVAQDERGMQESLERTARSGAIRLPAIVAIPTPLVLGFHPAAVGIARVWAAQGPAHVGIDAVD